MSTDTVPAASPEILGRIAQHLADGTLEVPVQDTYRQTVLRRQGVPASVASSGAVGGELACTDSLTSRVRPVLGVPRKLAHPER